jgi:REP element-mobilizing transposase RayT
MDVPRWGHHVRGMGRQRRSNLPGAPFHLISRTQGREPLFRGIEGAVARVIGEAAAVTRTSLLAWAVMPNHLHLLVVQGAQPLSVPMQLMLRRIAHLVKQRDALTGHVFQGRYREHACLDPSYLRNAIAYIHLNPVRAGLCGSTAGYEWTSHRHYCDPSGASPDTATLHVDAGLQLFARKAAMSRLQWIECYRQFIEWRLAADRVLKTDAADQAGDIEPAELTVPPPPTDGGDQYWWERWGLVCTAAQRRRTEAHLLSRRPDLATVARGTLADVSRNVSLETLRSSSRLPDVVTARRKVVERCTKLGYQNHQVARYLRISHSAVSRIVAAARESGVA